VLAREVEERGGRVVRFGTRPEADFALESCSWTLDSGSARIRTPGGPVEIETRLPGPHNARNATAALALGWALGLDTGAVARGLEATPVVPGRFELVDEGQPFD